ncbi:PEP-CTERM sorting domain-containing protein [Roseococcus sp. SYP-B2431]|uniref:PEP-CTERM sorting domain-containing protein n=1 Tax=Roseococcus sp. SYP-B2431 TaxID=2496640 RepID=UPI0013F4B5CC|nr:PEP-CTERM sorting domain-containing protein [Roseococcus sp. SYP-B2431]
MKFSFAALTTSALALLAVMVGTVPARAAFIDAEMTASYQYPTLGSIYGSATWTPVTFLVGGGVETQANIEGVTGIAVNFSASALSLLLTTILDGPTWASVPFNGPVFTATAPLGISGVSVNATTTMAGFDASRVAFTGSDIRIDWGGLSYTNGTVVALDFTFVPVPEPATIALLGFGLLALGAAARGRAAPQGSPG